MPAPRCSNHVLGFYDLELPAPLEELSRGRQTGGRSPDYQSLGRSTHRPMVEPSDAARPPEVWPS
jgi:hypothetical protein